MQNAFVKIGKCICKHSKMHLSKLQNVFGQKQLSPLRSPYKVPVNHGGGNLLGQIILVTFCTCLNMKQITYIQNTTKAWILHFLIKDWIQLGPACAPNLTSFNHVVFSIVFSWTSWSYFWWWPRLRKQRQNVTKSLLKVGSLMIYDYSW